MSKASLVYYIKWTFVASLVGVVCGGASAGFLFLLDAVTVLRSERSELLYFLPLGGLVIGLIYQTIGRSVKSGTNLMIDEFHNPKSVVPIRMAPLVLIGTLLTHLFGGSAGREGTAVQMGGSIADQFTYLFKMNRSDRRTLLMAGMSGGFASVFGVPVAGMIFGLEVQSSGRLHLWATIECAITAFVAHYVALELGVHHTVYVHPAAIGLTVNTAVLAIAAGICFGAAAQLFVFITSQLSRLFKKIMPLLPVRTFVGGLIIAGIYYFAPMTTRYAGLGLPLIEESMKTLSLACDGGHDFNRRIPYSMRMALPVATRTPTSWQIQKTF